MGVFKNGVGRPSNETIEQRRVIKVLILLAILFIVLLCIAFKKNLNKNKSVTYDLLGDFTYVEKYDKYKLYESTKDDFCSEIPNKYKPYNKDTNPEGLHEYGFTDVRFYGYIVSSIKNDKDYCSDITEEDFKKIQKYKIQAYRSGGDTSSYDGIQYLTNLLYLELGDSSAKSIDLSNNTKLEYLYINKNYLEPLESLKLNNNKNLEYLFIEDGFKNELDLSLDLSDNIKLRLIKIDKHGDNNISINLKNNINLEQLSIDGNVNEINLSNNKKLTSVSLISNNLNEIDLSNNLKLEKLYIKNKYIKKLNLNNNINLETLNLEVNELSNIDLNYNTNLKYLYISNVDFMICDGPLYTINLSYNKKLKSLELPCNHIENIDLSNNKELEFLDLHNNNIKDIDLSYNKELEFLDLHNNNIKDVDLSYNKKLKKIRLG